VSSLGQSKAGFVAGMVSDVAMNRLDLEAVAKEFPPDKDGHVYFNSGCCGRKPVSVLEAMARTYERLNSNPCHFTFNDSSPVDQARASVARLLSVPEQNILLASSTTSVLQILMQSFLLAPGDELVTTDQEHGSLRTIAQYLAETRGIVVHKYAIKCNQETGTAGSAILCKDLLSLVNKKTKLVAVSGIVSYTGWRPDLSLLAAELAERGVLLIADCAHGPGQMLCRPDAYPIWVGSGHKWLGGPNGTAFAYVRDDLRERLLPVALGDTYYQCRDADPADLSRLEGAGTADQSRWRGLTRAIDFHLGLGVEKVVAHQIGLAKYLRHCLEEKLNPRFRTNDLFDLLPSECTSILNFRFTPERLKVQNLQDYLWQEHKFAVQLDYLSPVPGHGMRISCHISNTRDEIDRLVSALSNVIIN
jgi:isopenicillin-N epimerase